MLQKLFVAVQYSRNTPWLASWIKIVAYVVGCLEDTFSPETLSTARNLQPRHFQPPDTFSHEGERHFQPWDIFSFDNLWVNQESPTPHDQPSTTLSFSIVVISKSIAWLFFPRRHITLNKLWNWTLGDLVRKISGINGDVTISDALTTISSDTKKTTPLTDLIEEDEEDGEEVKTIAGKGIKDANESDDLILHLVSTSLSNIHEK